MAEKSRMTWETFLHEADIGVRGYGGTLAEAFAGAVAEPLRELAREVDRRPH